MQDDDERRRELLRLLAVVPRRLPSSLHYDATGSRLFANILAQPGYYLTRSECEILRADGASIMSCINGIGAGRSALVELGASDFTKARLLLEAAPDTFRAYVPTNIDPSVLAGTEQQVGRERPDVRVLPIQGDFTVDLQLPSLPDVLMPVLFFPGGTAGQLDDAALATLFARAWNAVRRWPTAAFIVGSDTCRDVGRLRDAYADEAGANAAFNLNLLCNLNRIGDGDFDRSGFRHTIKWNEVEGRVEFYLESIGSQSARFGDQTFTFAPGELIETGLSYKRTSDRLRMLARQGGWAHRRCWSDPDRLVEVHLFFSQNEV